MLSALIEHSAVLGMTIIAMALLNQGLGLLVLRMQSRQRIFDLVPLNTPLGGSSHTAQLALPILMAVPMATLPLFLDFYSREALSGGYLVMQVVTLIVSLDSLLRLQVATVPGISDGRVTLSAQYQYRSVAARLGVLAIFCEIVAASFGNLAFTTGGVFVLASAVGYYRRAMRASRQTNILSSQVLPTDPAKSDPTTS
jgi:hypothetical protein